MATVPLSVWKMAERINVRACIYHHFLLFYIIKVDADSVCLLIINGPGDVPLGREHARALPEDSEEIHAPGATKRDAERSGSSRFLLCHGINMLPLPRGLAQVAKNNV